MQAQSHLVELQITELGPTEHRPFWIKILRRKNHRYTLILTSVEEATKGIEIEVGAYEGETIAVILQQMIAIRPLTHDLFKEATDQFGYKLNSIILDKIDENDIYHAKIYYSNNERTVTLDARPTDAIALALKSDAPIYIDRTLFDSNFCGITKIDAKKEADKW